MTDVEGECGVVADMGGIVVDANDDRCAQWQVRSMRLFVLFHALRRASEMDPVATTIVGGLKHLHQHC